MDQPCPPLYELTTWVVLQKSRLVGILEFVTPMENDKKIVDDSSCAQGRMLILLPIRQMYDFYFYDIMVEGWMRKSSPADSFRGTDFRDCCAKRQLYNLFLKTFFH